MVEQLDRSAIESVYEEEERGQPPYHPRMMTKLLIYGYGVGVFSSRRRQKKLTEDVGFRVLAAGNEPDFRTLSDFRTRHLGALQGLFDQVLQIALQAGTMKLGRVVLDGSKVKAKASKHRAMSYGRMQEEEKRLQEEVQRLWEQAEAADEEADARSGRERRGEERPAEWARRETRWQRIQEAQRALEPRAREQAQSQDEPEEKAQPKAQMQSNFTDPESRILPGADGFVQAYNAPIAVEPDLQWIVGQRVTPAAHDQQPRQPTLEVVRQPAGPTPPAVMTDRGYGSEANLQYLEKHKIAGFIATDRESLPWSPAAESAGTASRGSDARGAHAPETADPGGSGHLCPAPNDRGAGVRTEQTSARLPAVSLAWSGEGARGGGGDRSPAQPSEVTPALRWIAESKKGASFRGTSTGSMVWGNPSPNMAPSRVGRTLTCCFHSSALGRCALFKKQFSDGLLA